MATISQALHHREGQIRLSLRHGGKPASDNEGYDRWDVENSMVMSWLLNSMEPGIGRTYLFLPSAGAIWTAVQETYSDLGNASQLFEVKTKLRLAKQGEKSVTQYFTTLETLWQEIDLYCDLTWTCTTDSAMYARAVEKDRVFDFLQGLDKELDEVRGRILGREPLPSTREVFAEVRREESRRAVMLHKESAPSIVETSALMTSQPEYNPQRLQKRQERPVCEHCHRPGHVKAKCWKLYGKPADYQPSNHTPRDSKGYQVSLIEAAPNSSTEQSFFSKENLEQLYQLWSSHQNTNPFAPSSSLVQKGIIGSVFHTSKDNLDLWIIDSGATDHMTGSSYMFSTYYPCSGTQKVKIADGSLSSIAGKGSIIISPAITLHNVLHVPKLSCNLISVHKLIFDANCLINFSPTGCIFQDQCSARTIGSAKSSGGLYYLESTRLSSTQFPEPRCSNFLSLENAIMVWHYRLGHPSFGYLRHLFPVLFKNKNIDDFQCEMCQLAKHKRSVYPSLKYVPSKPFALIHSDIWGPSKIKKTFQTLDGLSLLSMIIRETHGYISLKKNLRLQVFSKLFTQ